MEVHDEPNVFGSHFSYWQRVGVYSSAFPSARTTRVFTSLRVTATASADALTFVLEQGPRFAAPTGDVVANPGSYALDPWEGTKLRFNRENTAPLAINTLSEHPDVMHVVHFPLNGHVLAAVGSLSGTQSPDITHAAPSYGSIT